MKKVGIMQPYFFPYIGYFSIIEQVDEFILFDTAQFMRHGWVERNRILKVNGEPLYIKVPLKKRSRETLINELVINDEQNWQDKIIAQLAPYKKKAKNYWPVIKLLKEVLDIDSDSIVEVNQKTLIAICKYLDIDTPITIWSEMDIEIEPAEAPDEWALNICKAIGANHYLNPIGGLSFFDRSKYTENNIKIDFLQSSKVPYQQFGHEFQPFLSIVDVLMFNDKEEVKAMLKKFDLS